MRAFGKAAQGKIKRAGYIFVHHTNGKYENAAREPDDLLGLRHENFRSVRCRVGKFKEITK